MTSSPSQPVNAAFWNLQNLFDVQPSPISSELGFTTVNGWDRRALTARIERLGAAIGEMFDGDGPDVLGLCEVENHDVVRQLMSATGRDDYAVVDVSHPLIQYADTVLIYSTRKFRDSPLRSEQHLVHLRFPTCDILEAELQLIDSETRLTVMVNHWPSQREAHSQYGRGTAAGHCARLIERHAKFNRKDYLELRDTELSRHALADRWNRNLLVMGSFNEDPWCPGIRDILNAGYSLKSGRQTLQFPDDGLPSWRTYSAHKVELFNPMWRWLALPDRGTGFDTDGRLRVFDQLLISSGLLQGRSGLQIECDAAGVPVVFCPFVDGMTDRPDAFRLHDQTGLSDRLPVGARLRVE